MFWLAACYLAILLVPGLPYFGEQAVRLLRESWDGILKADPKTGIIRPTGATSLAEELFAMLDDKVPQTQVGPTTMNPDPGTTPLTINNPGPGDGIKMNGGDISFARGGGINLPLGSPLNITGDGLTVDGSMNLNKGFYLWNGVPLLPGGGGGTTVFLARVVSGSGDTYLVDVYGNGADHATTNPSPAGGAVNIKNSDSGPPVTATVPQIHPAETLPVGTWISALYQFSNVVDGQTAITFEFQPPVWLA